MKQPLMKLPLPLLLAAGLSALPAEAGFRRFEATLDGSSWKTSTSPLSCSLSHDIPGFGRARFVSQHGRQPNLEFNLQTETALPNLPGEVVLRTLAPAWRHDDLPQDLGRHLAGSGRTLINLRDAQGWRLLSELEQGRFPTFFYEGYLDGGDTIAVGLSSVRFQQAFQRFRSCQAQLLPYTFNDIARSVLYFDHDKVEFNAGTRARLEQIKTYFKADPRLDLVLAEGHTDSQGGRWFNTQLGQKRAEAVKDFLVKAGIPAERIKTQTFGERKPVGNNRTEAGRAQNRRVVLTISR